VIGFPGVLLALAFALALALALAGFDEPLLHASRSPGAAAIAAML
jgi:hypothetical protein